MKKINLLAFCLVCLSLVSCVKTEGVGGGGHLKGKVIAKKYNTLNTLIATYPATDNRVYIIYGDDEFQAYDDDTRTSYDGSFEFKYLKKGNYKIFTYSKCRLCPSGQDSVVIATFKINSKNEVVELSDIIVRN